MAIASGLISMPEPIKPKSRAFDLKARLDWGEPALTIIDVRTREAFNASRIMGAISMPIDELVARASASLETERDIYIYGETDEQTEAAANHLSQVGYQNVAQLVGGLAAWKAANYPVEGAAPASV